MKKPWSIENEENQLGMKVGAMIKNDTWYETELPKEKKAVTSRLLFTINDKECIILTKAFLMASFDIKDLGELNYFLGIEICRSKERLFLSQRKYTLDLLSEAGELGSRVAKTPLEDGYKVLREGEFEDKHYRRMVGKLIYLTITRSDVCFVVNQVSRHMQKPKIHHWNMVERILRYLREAPGQRVWMACNEALKSLDIVMQIG
ncbi:uncharacterized mitochondrial protein AtMg00810-like [Brassica napus]|uniref:uncharacterized mitochondrial protein AtMg00810-like n=1 Tax=Brassica napus TaxID=3708 RepID=UPI0020799917|nr:uncharacterized mitochondrial protein AtMg00810-like [Brassica napus]